MNRFFDINDQVAVITGGNSGIGLSTAKRFHKAGAHVIIAGIGSGDNAIRDIEGGDFVETDVSSESQVKELMNYAAEKFGKIDTLVNCAGINKGYETLLNVDCNDFGANYSVNTMGVVFGIKYATPHMKYGGSIVNVASAAAKSGVPYLAPYVASKWAVVGITQTAALELGAQNIRVNAICPTSVDTPMAQAEGGEPQLAMEKVAVPLGRIAHPDEIAALIHFLASHDCTFINGQAINVDGGFSAGLSISAFNKLAHT
ncbi:SDR family NAD(P)-dependent oxidoreductase [Microbulbifer variabilis]|jgi:NAD(P)-dependent dehydrogenase (short-subunit alcohol dehydrogenase family)|uniref:SDR family oxidoreductase n=1 Tax=Microbulbifer variabilis TaxID=266805 RepID=A0ABY4VCA8_9GAMM|nr:SDR family oxidoreductase [Microbulbifer variabilis]USD19599.1 SDR family oxidoreductase [Microbulbifer variabilis]